MQSITENVANPCIRIKLSPKVESFVNNASNSTEISKIRNSFSNLPRSKWPLAVERLLVKNKLL